MTDRCPKCRLPLATEADHWREHPDECDVQAGTGESCWCGALCWHDEWTCGGDRGAARNAAAIRLARATVVICDLPIPEGDFDPDERRRQIAEYNEALAAFRELDAGDGAG